MDLPSGDFIGFKDKEAVIFQADDQRQFLTGSGQEIQRAQAQFHGIKAIEGSDQDIQGNGIQASACMLEPAKTIQGLVLGKLKFPGLPEIPEGANVGFGNSEGENPKEALEHHDRAPEGE